MDEEDEEEFDSDEPVAEESSHVADEDQVAEDEASHEVIRSKTKSGVVADMVDSRVPMRRHSAEVQQNPQRPTPICPEGQHFQIFRASPFRPHRPR